MAAHIELYKVCFTLGILRYSGKFCRRDLIPTNYGLRTRYLIYSTYAARCNFLLCLSSVDMGVLMRIGFHRQSRRHSSRFSLPMCIWRIIIRPDRRFQPVKTVLEMQTLGHKRLPLLDHSASLLPDHKPSERYRIKSFVRPFVRPSTFRLPLASITYSKPGP